MSTAGEEPGGVRPVRLLAWVQGRVQGVGFRWWVRSQALALGLSGYAENMDDGRVKVVAQGNESDCATLLSLLDGGQAPGRVTRVLHRWEPPGGDITGFCER